MTETCKHCGRPIYVWQETWIHKPDGTRWCYDPPVAEPVDA